MYIPSPSNGVNIRDINKDVLKGKTWRVSEKVDGVRRLFYKDSDGKVTAFSKSGIRDIWLKHITNFLEEARFPANMVYDCELVDREMYFSETDVPSFMLRTVTNSKASQKSYVNKRGLIAVCFDIFAPGSPDTGWVRTERLRKIFGGTLLTDPAINVSILGNMLGEDTSLLTHLLNTVYRCGGEGVMLMDMDSPYISGNSNTLIKVKQFDEFIGTIVDMELAGADTKIAGGISAIICNVDGCTVPVRIGTGFSHEQRINMAKDSKSYLGKKIEIEASSKTRDRFGNVSLSHPVFKRVVR